MMSPLRRTFAHLPTLGAIALTLLALVVTGLRLTLPAADRYREEVATALSDRLGLPVRLGALRLGLVGLSARLRLEEVALGDPQGGPDLLGLRALELDLDLLASLRVRSPQVRSATLVGSHLVVRRLADGRIQVDGLGVLQSEDPRTLALFLRQGRLNLVDSEISLLDDRVPGWQARLERVQLGMSNRGQIHRLQLEAYPASGRSAPGPVPPRAGLSLIADLRGGGSDPGTWAGGIYLALRGTDWLAMLPPGPTELPPARGEDLRVEGWLELRGGRLEQGLVRVAGGGLRLLRPRGGLGSGDEAPGEGSTPAAPAGAGVLVERLDALALLVRTGSGWRVGIRELGFAAQGAEITGLGLDLGLSAAGWLERLSLAVERLDLPLIGTLRSLHLAPLPQWAGRLINVDGRGRLERIGFELDGSGTGRPQWRLAAQGKGLGVAREGKIPGVRGLDLRLRANQDEGELALGSDCLDLELAPLFDRPLYLNRFSGLLSWTSSSDGALRLAGRNLVLANPDLSGRARFTLDLPARAADTGVPFLDLRASLHDADGSRARTYLPVGIMRPRLVDWLEGALVGGRVPQADLILRGPLQDFPFREHQGRFELLLQIADAGLDYRAGWPPIEGAAGALHLVDDALEVHLDSGRILDSVLTAGLARIPELRGARRLSIHGEAEGPLSDGLRVLTETPLGERLGLLAQGLEVSGSSKLALDLEVPLAQGEPLGLDGHLTLPGDAGLAVRGTPVRVTDLAGELRFTRDGLSAQSTQARLWGLPLELGVASRSYRDPGGAGTEIRARAQIPVSVLAGRLPSPAWAVAVGEAGWDLVLDLPPVGPRPAGPPVAWRLRSDLRGLALDLPSPLGKPAAASRSLDLAGTLHPGQSLDLRGSVGGLGLELALGLSSGSPRIKGGRVVLGGGAVVPGSAARAPGLRLEGSLEALDLAAWGRWWSRLRGGQGVGVSTEGWGVVPPLQSVGLDLRVGHLGLGVGALTDARIRLDPGGDGVRLELDSRELAGQLILPLAGVEAPLRLDLARLDLVGLTPLGDRRGAASGPLGGEGALMRALPATDVRVADLRRDGVGLGRLSLDLRPEPSGLGVRRIELQGPADTGAQGEADWEDGPDGGRSRLSLEVRSADTGSLIRALGYRSALSQAPLELRLRLNWPGGPGDFTLARSAGRVDLKLGAGRLLEVEPGVGRVLGILNLGALSRRLTLDFTDLYAQGFAFEQIQGEVRVGDGRAELGQFQIEGPSSTIRVSGLADLRSRTFDQMVTVEPRIGSSVALAGALAGGPVVGAAVYLADKVAGGAIDKLGAYRYRITGPWADPELTRLGWDPFDIGGAGSPTNRSGQSGAAAPGPTEWNHFLD